MLYENNNYYIREITEEDFPACNEKDNYAIVNKSTGCVEDFSANLPQAKLNAAQFDRLLATDYHEQIVDSMFGDSPDPMNAEIVKLFDDSDDGGGLH